ncbi:MAG: hypothetical protein LIP05_16650 [Tannerellaceae bacterium]|nr:hypothetical protein [Tannerellaceae bacterium]
MVRSGVLSGMIDIHTHLLPGVDDGVRDQEEAFEALAFMKEAGVRKVCFTPHIMADLSQNYPEILQEKFETFVDECPVRIDLQLAGEYMLDQGFMLQLERGLLTMADNHILIETFYMAPPPDLYHILYELEVSGYKPILAHPERYLYMQERDYRLLKGKGCRFQLNLFSLAGYYGKMVQMNAKMLLKQQMYDFTGSDFHHLNGYNKGLHTCLLTSSQCRDLQQVISNNRLLWTGKS